MFGFMGGRTRGEMVRAELGESLGHLRRATTHAAAGISATVGPRIKAAQGYASPAMAKARNKASNGLGSTMAVFAPMAAAARNGLHPTGTVAQKARSRDMQNMKAIRMRGMPGIRNTMMGGRRSRPRWPRMAGLLAAGAAVGAVGAMALRHRRQRRWEEYDPSRVMAAREGMEPMIGVSPAEAIRASAGSTGPESPIGSAEIRGSGV